MAEILLSLLFVCLILSVVATWKTWRKGQRHRADRATLVDALVTGGHISADQRGMRYLDAWTDERRKRLADMQRPAAKGTEAARARRHTIVGYKERPE